MPVLVLITRVIHRSTLRFKVARNIVYLSTLTDPDLALREGGVGSGLDLLALLAFFPSVISSFFTQN